MKQVLAAYEQLGKKYLVHRQSLKSDAYVRLLLKQLSKNSSILDIGCGAGVPVDDIIVKAGHEVTGIDLSPSLIKEARKLVPEASYFIGDMQHLKLNEYSVDAVVCLYALFHIPRSEHSRMIKIFASYLPINGWMLISMGDRAYEGEHEMYGVASYSSQWGSLENRGLIKAAGLRIEYEEFSSSFGERHQMILAQKLS
jgi:trans-aconitate methyltransferase